MLNVQTKYSKKLGSLKVFPPFPPGIPRAKKNLTAAGRQIFLQYINGCLFIPHSPLVCPFIGSIQRTNAEVGMRLNICARQIKNGVFHVSVL